MAMSHTAAQKRSGPSCSERHTSPPGLMSDPASMFLTCVEPIRPACASIQNGWLLPGCVASRCCCAAARSAFGCANAAVPNNTSNNTKVKQRTLAYALVLILHPRALFHLVIPGELIV